MNNRLSHLNRNSSDTGNVGLLNFIFSEHKSCEPHINQLDKEEFHDGYVRLRDNVNYENLLWPVLFVQVKTLKPKKTVISHTFEDKFLDECRRNTHCPIIVIVVDKGKREAYWEEMNETVLANLKGRKEKTVHFNPQKKISSENNQYHSDWITIHNRRCEDSKTSMNEERLRQPVESRDERLTEEVRNSLEKVNFIDGVKCNYFFGFMHLVSPYSLDEIGSVKREAVRILLGISEFEEKSFIDKLEAEGKIKIVSENCFIEEVDLANTRIEEIINSDLLDLDMFVNLFS